MKDTPYGYGTLSKLFHWVLALLIIGMMLGGLTMDFWPPEYKGQVMFWHKSVGLLAGMLMVLRLLWRAFQGFPKLPDGIQGAQRIAARAVHFAFYPLVILMPVAGWVMSSAAGRPTSFFGLFPMPDLVAPDPCLLYTSDAADDM
jgi:cytochrome b561